MFPTEIENLNHRHSTNFFLIAGPCVIEEEGLTRSIAAEVASLSDKYSIPFIFKASYRKANRSKTDSFTGIGDKEGLEILQKIREDFKIPVDRKSVV